VSTLLSWAPEKFTVFSIFTSFNSLIIYYPVTFCCSYSPNKILKSWFSLALSSSRFVSIQSFRQRSRKSLWFSKTPSIFVTCAKGTYHDQMKHENVQDLISSKEETKVTLNLLRFCFYYHDKKTTFSSTICIYFSFWYHFSSTKRSHAKESFWHRGTRQLWHEN